MVNIDSGPTVSACASSSRACPSSQLPPGLAERGQRLHEVAARGVSVRRIDLDQARHREEPVPQRQDLVSLCGVLDDEDLGACVSDDEFALLADVGGVDGNGDAACQEDRHVAERPLDARLGQEANTIAGDDPGGDEAGRDLPRRDVRLGEGHRLPTSGREVAERRP